MSGFGGTSASSTNTIGGTFRRLSSSVATVAQQTFTGGSVVALTALAVTNRLIVQSDSTNTTNIRIGDVAVTPTRGMQLAPGDTFEFYITNSNLLNGIVESGSVKLNIYAE